MSVIVFTFNIRQSVYNNLGLKPFTHIKNNHGIHLFPIVTTLTDSIQERAKKIKRNLPHFLQKIGAEKVHLASYSVNGLDMRYALNQHNLDKYCKTLTTIATPHKGSKLAYLSDRKTFRQPQIQALCRMLGIGVKPFYEVSTQNIKYFNDVIENKESINYFSIGGQKQSTKVSETLEYTGNYLQYKVQPNFIYHNDGVFGHDEIVWGDHLMNFEADHGELIGILGKQNKKQKTCFQLIKQVVEDWEEKNSEKAQHLHLA